MKHLMLALLSRQSPIVFPIKIHQKNKHDIFEESPRVLKTKGTKQTYQLPKLNTTFRFTLLPVRLFGTAY